MSISPTPHLFSTYLCMSIMVSSNVHNGDSSVVIVNIGSFSRSVVETRTSNSSSTTEQFLKLDEIV